MQKKLILISSLLLLTYTINAQITDSTATDTIFQYTSKEGNCEITFPNIYNENNSVSKNGLQSSRIRGMYNGNVFILTYVVHKKSFTEINVDEMADASINSLSNAVNGTVTDKKEYIYKGYKGKDAFIQIKNKKLNIFNRVLIAGLKQYQITVITKEKNKTKKITAFFNSFKLL